MVSQSRTAKRSSFNPIPLIIAIALIIGVFAVATEAKAGSVDATEAGSSAVGSLSLTAPSIGWDLEGSQVTGTRISWTPISSGTYTINVAVGNSIGSVTVWAAGSEARTDLVSIWPAVGAMHVESANLVINEN